MKSLLKLGILAAALTVALAAKAEPTLPTDAEVQAHLAALEGVFEGAENVTPFGPLSIAFSFVREENGDVHAHSAQDASTWIDLRFTREGDTWRFAEGASMPGLGVQEYTMDLVGHGESGFVWEVVGRPGFLQAVTYADAEGIRLTVSLRGKPHVDFKLPRVVGPRAEQIAAELARRAAGDFSRASR